LKGRPPDQGTTLVSREHGLDDLLKGLVRESAEAAHDSDELRVILRFVEADENGRYQGHKVITVRVVAPQVAEFIDPAAQRLRVGTEAVGGLGNQLVQLPHALAQVGPEVHVRCGRELAGLLQEQTVELGVPFEVLQDLYHERGAGVTFVIREELLGQLNPGCHLLSRRKIVRCGQHQLFVGAAEPGTVGADQLKDEVVQMQTPLPLFGGGQRAEVLELVARDRDMQLTGEIIKNSADPELRWQIAGEALQLLSKTRYRVVPVKVVVGNRRLARRPFPRDGTGKGEDTGRNATPDVVAEDLQKD